MDGNAIVKAFEDLHVYQKAYRLALEIHKITMDFPRGEHGFSGLVSQMRRASKGICANIAEGFAKQRASSLEFKRFITMAIASADEMRVWLSFAKDLGYIGKSDSENLTQSYIDIAKMLSGLAKKWQ